MKTQSIFSTSAKIIPLYPERGRQPEQERQREMGPRLHNELPKRATALVKAHINDEYYGIEQLCKDLAVSRPQLHRALKEFTGFSASHFIRNIRLKKAETLLLSSSLSISEIAYEVGFSDPRYFSRVFSSIYRRSPRDFRNRQD